MTDTTTRTSGKAAAAAAAKTMLAERVKLVETLGDKLDNHQRRVDATAAAARAAEEHAVEEVRGSYTDALKGGWSASEPRSAGLTPPASVRPRRLRHPASRAVGTDPRTNPAD